ncbi:DNA (cytosine-5-)-methyltransferase [Metabacillus indicus]|uniref:DNA (cytosine-5-)-methyltransferase n=1 Tax=Metabacillus indicus TaxID=246786 RepID=UPI002A07905D|nr:DNA (cytosine-5-)-methyltransferase [Metabacillus indicus]MDX8289125.1 DNA (cytosine-5-)-methyltransferase [Metabacillus indicus]
MVSIIILVIVKNRKDVRILDIKVVELFAGVGGFHLGLDRAKGFEVVWANQWEPSTKTQHAFECYVKRFGNNANYTNDDISKVWPDTPFHDLLVGGFPCQDYSVARSLSGELGIQGKKGVLFWEIMNIILNRKPKYILLENVDRLLKSPSSQRGRDFSVMLASLRDAGYDVEWRVINAADYGFAQKRRRVFIFAVNRTTEYARKTQNVNDDEMLYQKGFFATSFMVEQRESERHKTISFTLPDDIVNVSDSFSVSYRNSGIMRNGQITTKELSPIQNESKNLGEVVRKVYETNGPVDNKYFLDKEKISKNGLNEIEAFQYLKGPKKIERTSLTGHKYQYAEGGMAFPDPLNSPGRTMLTSEGTKNRSTHVIEDPIKKSLRYITPEECEVMNDFPVGWTDSGMPLRTRYFCMGNALVVGLVEIMGNRIKEIHQLEMQKLEKVGFEQHSFQL